MSINTKFYKIKLLKQFLERTDLARKTLFNELIVNATDPTVYKRRFRMLQQLNDYETQVLKKIYDFDTDDIADLDLEKLLMGLRPILNRNA
jgi:hypothetical protein